MKKRIEKSVAILLAAILVLSSAPFAFAAGDVVDSGFCGGEGDGTNISWTLDSEGTLTLSGSGAMADYSTNTIEGNLTFPWYSNRGSVKRVVLDDRITKIGKYAFQRCSSILSVSFPASLKMIDSQAFDNCTSLQSITLPDGLETIATDAFYACWSLQSVSIPKTVTELGNVPFRHCKALTSLTVDRQNPVFRSAGNCIIKTETQEIVQGCSGSVIPNDGSIKTIGDDAFESCTQSSISIPGSVTRIGSYAFSFMSNLTEIIVPDSVLTIAFNAFGWDRKLESVTLSSSITSIGGGLFAGCSKLREIVIPDGVTKINELAFEECTALEKVTIPDSVTRVCQRAFNRCSSLSEVVYPGTRQQWESITIDEHNVPLINAYYGIVCDHVPGTPVRNILSQPTCTSDGDCFEYVYCSLCGDELQNNYRTIPATGHQNTVTVSAKEATYDEHGYKEGVFCTDCETWISGHEVIHNTFGEREIVREATEDEPGEMIITCTVCGERGLYEYSYQAQDNDSDEEDSNPTIGERIRKAVRGIINVFLRLIKWLGGNKK